MLRRLALLCDAQRTMFMDISDALQPESTNMAEIARPRSLDLREQIARIDLLLAESHRKKQEYTLAPIALMIAGFTSGAAIFAAGAAFIKLIG
jgi:hypothetical protein